MKRLTVIIPMYMDKNECVDLINMTSKYRDDSLDIFYINDLKFDFILEGEDVFNNDINMGKFWSITNVINKIRTHFFLTIDPDDIHMNNIDWENLLQLAKFLSDNIEFTFDYAINDYTIVKKFFKQKTKSKKNKVYFNPNLIYNTKNVSSSFLKTGINFDGKKITYFEDVLLLLLSNVNGDKANLSKHFYTYVKNYGVTSDWTKFSDEIIEAKKVMDLILEENKCNLYDKNILSKRISRVNKKYNKISKRMI